MTDRFPGRPPRRFVRHVRNSLLLVDRHASSCADCWESPSGAVRPPPPLLHRSTEPPAGSRRGGHEGGKARRRVCDGRCDGGGDRIPQRNAALLIAGEVRQRRSGSTRRSTCSCGSTRGRDEFDRPADGGRPSAAPGSAQRRESIWRSTPGPRGDETSSRSIASPLALGLQGRRWEARPSLRPLSGRGPARRRTSCCWGPRPDPERRDRSGAVSGRGPEDVAALDRLGQGSP